jgi:PAS domain S-box-containing protein
MSSPREPSATPPETGHAAVTGVVVAGPAGTVAYLDPGAESLTGWTLDAARGQPLAAVVRLSLQTPETTTDLDAILSGSREAAHVPLALCHARGISRPIALTTIPVRDANGGLASITVLLRDLHPTEQIGEGRGSRLRAVVQGMPVLMDAFDERMLITVWNAECERVTGFKAEEMVGNPDALSLLYPDPAYRERMMREWNERGQNYRNWAWDVTCKDGSTRTIEWSNVSAQYPIPGWATWGIGVDVTDRRRLEGQLLHAQKMEAIGTLAGGVAHDFNNILAAILGNAHLAHEDLEPSHAASRSVAEIVQAAERGRALVEQILAFSHKRAPEKRLIHPRAIVEESVKLLRATLPTGIELVVHIDDPLPAIVADATQLEQVVINLGTNAWHAIDGGHGCIEIRLSPVVVKDGEARARVPAGRWARLTVADTGRGIDAETLNRIFEPYFTTKGPGKGTGLGLPVVHAAVQSHDGHIEVTSTPGVGTTVSVYLPAAIITDAPAATSLPSAAHRGNGQRILYVDDERALVVLAIRGLGRLGYRVHGCTSAIEALACVRDDPSAFDLMVTDNNMPEASGIELTRDVRALRRDLPVIIVSGYVDDDLRAAAGAVGIGHVLYKPSTLTELSQVIGRLLLRAGI